MIHVWGLLARNQLFRVIKTVYRGVIKAVCWMYDFAIISDDKLNNDYSALSFADNNYLKRLPQQPIVNLTPICIWKRQLKPQSAYNGLLVLINLIHAMRVRLCSMLISESKISTTRFALPRIFEFFKLSKLRYNSCSLQFFNNIFSIFLCAKSKY